MRPADGAPNGITFTSSRTASEICLQADVIIVQYVSERERDVLVSEQSSDHSRFQLSYLHYKVHVNLGA